MRTTRQWYTQRVQADAPQRAVSAPLSAPHKMLTRMLRPTYSKKDDEYQMSSLPSYSYGRVRVSEGEPVAEWTCDTKSVSSDRRIQRLLAYGARLAGVLLLSVLVVFMLIWRHLFSVNMADAGAVSTSSRFGSREKTFTVRWVRGTKQVIDRLRGDAERQAQTLLT